MALPGLDTVLKVQGLSEDEQNYFRSLHRLSTPEWLAAFLRADQLTSQSLSKLSLAGWKAEADLVGELLHLPSMALRATTGRPLGAGAAIHTYVAELLGRVRRGYEQALKEELAEALPPLREEAAQAVRAELRPAHEAELRALRGALELLEHAATAAQAEASAAERRVRELEAQLSKARFDAAKFEARSQAGARVPGLEADLNAERQAHAALRSAVIEQARETRGREATLTRRVSELTHQVHALEQERDALRTDLAASPPSQEFTVSKLTPQPSLPVNALESASLCVFLRTQGIAATWTAAQVDHGGRMKEAHAQAWRAAYPDRAAMLAQLRAVVGRVLRGEGKAA